MTPRTVARRYAAALFDVVHTSGDIDRAERDLRGFADAVAGHPELQHVFESPAIPAEKKRAVAEALFAASGDVSAEVRRLVLLLADRERLAIVGDIASAFAARVMQAKKIVPAEVVTAVALPDGPRHALAQALGKAAGGEVRMTARVDPGILGGVIAKVGTVVYDGSVTHQVERMRQRLMES